MKILTRMLGPLLIFTFFLSPDSVAEKVEFVADLNINQSTVSAMCSSNAVEYQGQLYFCADDGRHGRELYTFDSSTQQAQLVADINAGSEYSSPDDLYVFNNKLYFTATDGIHGRELFVYDVATENTVLVADVNEGNESQYRDRSYISNLVGYKNKLYFVAQDGEHPRSLFEYDDQTQQLIQLNILPTNVSLDISYMAVVVYANKLYFTARTKSQSSALYKVFQWQQGDALANELDSSLNGVSYNRARLLVVDNDTLYFTETDDEGAKLYAYSDSDYSTHLVVDMLLAREPQIAFLNNNVYFTGYALEVEQELYQYNLDSRQIERLTNLPNNFDVIVSELYILGNNIYYAANIAMLGEPQYELFELNTFSNTVKLISSEYTGVYSSSPSSLIGYNGKLYFSAEHGRYGRELFVYLPNMGSTELTVDINSKGTSSPARCFTELNDNIYFILRSALYKLDKNTRQVELAYDVNQNEYIGEANFCMKAANGKLFFFVDRIKITATSSYVELYQYDPMAKKGGKIIAVDEVFGFWDTDRVTVKDDRLYIRSYYEGTIEYDIDTETKINFATASTQFYFVGDKLYATETATQKLYVFDSKTKKKSYILPEQLSAVSSLMPYKGKLYFAAIADGDKGKELYSYDPNADKLELVEDYNEGKDHSYPTALQMQKNLLFFEITRGENVGQYVYDGINSPLLLSEYLNLEDGMEVCKVVNAQVKDKLLILISPSHDQLCGLYIFDINTHSSKLIDSHPDRIAQMFDAQNENTVYYLTGYYSDSYLRWKQVLYRYDILTEKLSIVHADIKSIPIFYASSLLFSAYDERLYTHSYNYSTQSYGLNEIYFGPDVVAEEVNNDWFSLGNKLYFPGVHRDYGYSLLSFYANTSAEGSVDINGSPVAGAQLTAGTNITDIDGVGALTFQWLRNSEKIPDADSQTYTVTGEDFEHEITVEVSYYDNEGNFELVVSNPVIILIDTDGDGIADATDTDDDNDGVLDTVDAFPLDASRSDLVIVDDRKSSSGGSFGVLVIWLLAAYAFRQMRSFD